MPFLLIIFLIASHLFPQDLITNPTELHLIEKEIHSLESNKIQEELFLSPFIRKNPKRNYYYNIAEKIVSDKRFVLEPIMSFRFSDSGLEMSDVSSSAYWLTPGFKIHSTTPIINNMSSIWIYLWVEFYKHSAVFDESVNNPSSLFEYSPDYSTGFDTGSVEPDNAFDFDQSQAGVS